MSPEQARDLCRLERAKRAEKWAAKQAADLAIIRDILHRTCYEWVSGGKPGRPKKPAGLQPLLMKKTDPLELQVGEQGRRRRS